LQQHVLDHFQYDGCQCRQTVIFQFPIMEAPFVDADSFRELRLRKTGEDTSGA